MREIRISSIKTERKPYFIIASSDVHITLSYTPKLYPWNLSVNYRTSQCIWDITISFYCFLFCRFLCSEIKIVDVRYSAYLLHYIFIHDTVFKHFIKYINMVNSVFSQYAFVWRLIEWAENIITDVNSTLLRCVVSNLLATFACLSTKKAYAFFPFMFQ